MITPHYYKFNCRTHINFLLSFFGFVFMDDMCYVLMHIIEKTSAKMRETEREKKKRKEKERKQKKRTEREEQ